MDTGVVLVRGGDQVPGRGLGVGGSQHVIYRDFVGFPLCPVAPIVVGDLPLFVGCLFPVLEACELFVGVEVRLDLGLGRGALGDELGLEILDLGIGAFPRLLGDQVLDPLHQHPAIPAAVE